MKHKNVKIGMKVIHKDQTGIQPENVGCIATIINKDDRKVCYVYEHTIPDECYWTYAEDLKKV